MNVDEAEPNSKLSTLLKSGDLAIVAAGFRCHTKIKISAKLGVSQESLPFDSGFFPPTAIASMLNSLHASRSQPSSSFPHTVCKKFAGVYHETLGRVIKFESSSYDEIDSLVLDPQQPDINTYLDRTFGYYTLNHQHQYVLAHYNWHKFAAAKFPERVCDPLANTAATGALLARRLARLHRKCEDARWVIFIYDEWQGFSHMMLDDTHFDLTDVQPISEAATKVFGQKCQVARLSDISGQDSVLEMLS